MRLLEAGIERIGLVVPSMFNTVVEKLVVVALVCDAFRACF